MLKGAFKELDNTLGKSELKTPNFNLAGEQNCFGLSLEHKNWRTKQRKSVPRARRQQQWQTPALSLLPDALPAAARTLSRTGSSRHPQLKLTGRKR
jgi:hypothetical protein